MLLTNEPVPNILRVIVKSVSTIQIIHRKSSHYECCVVFNVSFMLQLNYILCISSRRKLLAQLMQYVSLYSNLI